MSDRIIVTRDAVQTTLDNAPTVDTIEIPKNVTNGDMIKTMFPNGTESIGRKKIYYSFYPNGDMEFNITWWNAPYKNIKK